PYLFTLFLFKCYSHHRALHSFPTRRSSDLEDCTTDRDRYQTVFAKPRGSIAAPTAGLHFTSALLAACVASGIEIAEITLHVGYGDRKSTRLNSSHLGISYAVFCLKKKKDKK